ncbi:unnamed protein product [Nippostrongylus brasiliensis]|uniref:SCP domain-containing protein n=1 Tax=Nippostrongylus brasiliensis TaxID=27835 RepID=A0A0N4YB07_NIPBR|nr:unnamed protein product [Nippostrongylus brasiliensis]
MWLFLALFFGSTYEGFGDYGGPIRAERVAFHPRHAKYLREVLASLCPPGLINDAERANFLFLHNMRRLEVALQQARLDQFRYLPGTEEMYEMVSLVAFLFPKNYNCELEHIAEMSTRNCELVAIPDGTSINFKRFLTYPMDKLNLSFIAMDYWSEPNLNFPIDNNVTYSDPRLESFANMIYYKSLQIGCSIGTCRREGELQQAVACVYSSRPQLGSAMYLPKEGTTGCTTFSGCRVIPNSVCNGGLCISFTSQIVAATTAEPSSAGLDTKGPSTESPEYPSTAPYHEPSTPTPTKQPHRHHNLHGKILLNMEIDMDE